MLLALLFLALGLALIIKGGDLFVSSSVRIAEFLRMPRMVIGSTLVSLATTSPELVVSIVAALKGEPGLAIGNAVGSCICNVGLILGLTAALKHIDVHPGVLKVPLFTMLGLGVVLFILTIDLNLTQLQGGFLILVGIFYFIYDFQRHKKAAPKEQIEEAGAIEEELLAKYSWFHTGWGTAAQFLIGAVLVVGGSQLLVESAMIIAQGLGISPIVLGLTVVAVGTSLPELVTAISSYRQNVSDLAIGNILGANIANISLIAGSAASIHDLTLNRVDQLYNFPAMLVLMGMLVVMILSGRRISRREGGTLLSAYGLYLAGLIIITIIMLR
jgi:cation:H+ antiporter